MPSSHVPRPGRPNSQCYGRYTIEVNCEQAANRIDRKGFTGPWDSEPSQMFKSQSSRMKDQQTPAEVVRSLPSRKRRLNHAVILHQARYEHGSSGKVASEAEQQVRVAARQRRATLINLALDILNRQHCVPVMENLTVLGSNLDQDPNLRKQRGQPTARITTGVHCQNPAPIIIKIGHKREPRLSELVLNPVPNHVGETAVWPSTPILFDKVTLAGWKTGPGRKKDWKTSQYINLPRKLREMGLQSSDRSFRSILPYWTSSKAVGNLVLPWGCPFHAGMPLNMLRYKAQHPNNSRSTTQPIAAWFRRELSFHAPKGFRPRNHASNSSLDFQEYEDYDYEEYRALDGLEDNLRIPEDQGAFSQHSDPTMSDIEDHKSLSLSEIAPSAVLPALGHSARGRKAKARPANHLIPYESFIGSHLGRSFRLIGLVSCERHYDLYNVECLYDPNRQYEARAYQLRGIVAKEREKRVRSLRRCSANPCVVGKLEQGGKKWVVSQSASGALEKPISTCPVKNGHGCEYQSEGRSVKDVRARSVGKPRSNETPVETRVPPSEVKSRVSESKRLYTQKSAEQVK